jgi:hypothetical protein
MAVWGSFPEKLGLGRPNSKVDLGLDKSRSSYHLTRGRGQVRARGRRHTSAPGRSEGRREDERAAASSTGSKGSRQGEEGFHLHNA